MCTVQRDKNEGTKMAEKKYKRDIERACIVEKVANITGYKKDTVRKVIRDERKNETILTAYMEIKESLTATENSLLKAVKEAVPFN